MLLDMNLLDIANGKYKFIYIWKYGCFSYYYFLEEY